MSSDLLGRQKLYPQKYRPKWESMKEFSGWLRSYPKYPEKAICSICNVVVKAHLCDLRKHGESKRHNAAIGLLKTLGTYSGNDDVKFEESHPVDTEDDDSDSDENSILRWSSEAVDCLIKYVSSYWMEFKDGYRKKEDIWLDVSNKISDDGFRIESEECEKKFQNIKQIYYLKVLGVNTSSYIGNFDQLDKLLCNEPETLSHLEQKKIEFQQDSTVTHVDFDEDGKIVSGSSFDMVEDDDVKWTDAATVTFLDLFFEFIKVKNGKIDDSLWESVSEKMAVVGHCVEENECRHKWKNLIEQYGNYKSISDDTGEIIQWPYYMKVQRLVDVYYLQNEESIEKVPETNYKRKRSDNLLCSSPLKMGKNGTMNKEFDHISNKKKSQFHEGNGLQERVSQLQDKATMWQRLNILEERVEALGDQTELIKSTNLKLREILAEMSTLSSNLAFQPKHLLDNPKLSDRITLMVPQDQN